MRDEASETEHPETALSNLFEKGEITAVLQTASKNPQPFYVGIHSDVHKWI